MQIPPAAELKRAIDPAAFYARELPDAPALRRTRQGWSQNIRCPFHEEDTGSFGVHLDTGAAHCFGCGFDAGSIIDFTMARHGLDLRGACERLASDWAIEVPAASTGAAEVPGRQSPPSAPRGAPHPIEPIPEAALATRPRSHPRFGEPSGEWVYRDEAGRPLYFVQRFDPPGKRKVFAPQTWGPEGWQWRAPPAPRPLYRLDRLAARPEAAVCITEGEKAAEAAAKLLPAMVVTTTMNGAQSPAKSDFTPLREREIFIWPDADPAGIHYAETVARLALEAGAAAVFVLDLTTLEGGPRDA